MDVRGYYRKLREKANELPEGDLAVVSEVTPDGGKAGVLSVVSREIACRLLVERRARLASVEEVEAFEAEQREARKAWQAALEAERIQIQLITGLEKAARTRNPREK
jgi:hypothetical protein